MAGYSTHNMCGYRTVCMVTSPSEVTASQQRTAMHVFGQTPQPFMIEPCANVAAV